MAILIHFVSHFSWDFTQEKLKTMIMQTFLGANKVYYGQCGNEVAVIALVFVSVSSSVPFVHCTGPVKPADDVHMVSGCTVAPMAYFYIYIYIVQLHIPSISLKYNSQFLQYYNITVFQQFVFDFANLSQ